MKISSQEEYGLRCVLQLARNPESSLNLGDIAEREGLSLAYVGKLMAQLRENGLVESVRGRGGGYLLRRPPEEISVRDVLSALGGPLFEDTFCASHHGVEAECVHVGIGCNIRALWGGLDVLIGGFLGKTSLADLLGGQAAQHRQASNITAGVPGDSGAAL